MQAGNLTKGKLQEREISILDQDMFLVKGKHPGAPALSSLSGRRLRAGHLVAVTPVDDMLLKPTAGLEDIRASPAPILVPIVVIDGRRIETAKGLRALRHVVDAIGWQAPFTHVPDQVIVKTGLVGVSFLAARTNLS